jgi:hypothetical protein
MDGSTNIVESSGPWGTLITPKNSGMWGERHALLLWGNGGVWCRSNCGGILKKAAQILSKAHD